MPNTTYIAVSYVEFLESAGARVVPIHYDSSDGELKALSSNPSMGSSYLMRWQSNHSNNFQSIN
jgi:hypothetical protein